MIKERYHACSACISHKFGEDRRTRKHNGVDYAVEEGTPVKAAASGRVVAATFLNPKEDKIVENGKEKKKFTGAYGNVIVIYHGRNIEKSTHIYTLYAHLDERSVSEGEKVKLGQTIGRSGTRLDYYNWKGGYGLHFEVLKTPKELTPSALRSAYADKKLYRRDPEILLRSSIKTVFADDLVKEALDRLKKEILDIDELVGKWAKFATESGYVGVSALTPVLGPLGPKVGVYYKPSDVTAYVSLDVGLFTKRSLSVVYSRDDLAIFSRGAYAGPVDIS